LKLDKTSIEKLEVMEGKQVVYWDDEIKGFGLRVSPGGAKTFFYQGRLKGKSFKMTIGRYGKLTAKQGRDEAKRVAAMVELNQDPRQAKEPKEAPVTFGEVMDQYAAYLEKRGKVSARAVANTLHKWIRDEFPKVWNKPAAQVSIDDCMKPIDHLTENDKGRTADKVRSYMVSAFKMVINARGRVGVPERFRHIGIKANPAAGIEKPEGASEARERVLSVAEFRAYWRRLESLPEPDRSLAKLHVLTGGQRQKQLARVTFSDIDRDQGGMVILDYKGKRAQPRRHHVPLLPECLEMIDSISSGPFVFSASGGKTAITDRYLNDIVSVVREEMEKAGELENGAFTAGTIRATIETRLAKAPYYVPKEIRAQLQSHGLGGVQDKHYLHDEFHDEKVSALLKLKQLLMDEEVQA